MLCGIRPRRSAKSLWARACCTLVLVVLGLLRPTLAYAQSPGESLSAEWQILGPADPPTVGDVITLRLQVTHPADVRVELPALPTQWGDLEVRALRPGTQEATGDDLHTTSLEVDAVAWTPGEHHLAPMNVVYRDAVGALQELFVESGTITVASVLTEDDLAMRDLKPQAEIPRPPAWPWVVAGVVMAVGAVWLMRRLLQRRRARALGFPAHTAPVDHRTPQQIALEELQRIEALHLVERREFKRFYSLLTDCVRAYLQRRYAIQVMDLTTVELLRAMARAHLQEAAFSALEGLLRSADLVKFAKLRPEVRDAEQGLALARRIVHLTTPVQADGIASGQSTTPSAGGV